MFHSSRWWLLTGPILLTALSHRAGVTECKKEIRVCQQSFSFGIRQVFGRYIIPETKTRTISVIIHVVRGGFNNHPS